MNTNRATLIRKTVRGHNTSLKRGMAVKSRPSRSPVFQKRKASGMKHAGWRIRGVAVLLLSSAAGVAGKRTLTICCVKTGKNMVMAKVRKTALARYRSFLKRIHRPTTTTLRLAVAACSGVAEVFSSSSGGDLKSVDSSESGWRRKSSMKASRAAMETAVAVRKYAKADLPLS